MISAIYQNNAAIVITGSDFSSWFGAEAGAKLVCVLSPTLS